MASAEKVFVRDLEAGQVLDSTFAVVRKERRRTRDGRSFLALELADRSGRVRANVFDDAALLDGRFDQGDTVRVVGTVEEYRNKPSVVVRDVERVAAGDPLVYTPGARRDTEDLDGFLDFLAAEVHDRTLSGLVERIFGDRRFRARFREAPVTIDGHHAYAGGALEHTVAVATLCREAAQLHPRLDEPLLAAAALTCVIGAADGFAQGATLRQSDAGELLALPLLSLRLIERAAREAGTPEARLVPLLHAVSQTRPRTPEAAALQAAIALDVAASGPT